MTLLDGAAFALDAPTHVEAVWGDGSRVLWARGEPLMVAGPDGVGKATLAQQLVLRRAGIGAPALLGHTVAVDDRGRVLYLALDRPRQAARSMRRMVTEDDREGLQRRLVVWPGELPFDVVSDPPGLLAFAREHGAGTVVIDSLKDVADELQPEDVGKAINRAMQLCVGAGVEVLALHHQRKAQAENKKPRKLADVYGSRWLTAGCGSVLMLWGEAGDPAVELTHLKQPADQVGPLTLLHDNHAGTTTVQGAAAVVDVLGASTGPLTVKDIAIRLLKVSDPQRNDIAKAKRRLGEEQTFTSYGGLLAGFRNTVSAGFGSVMGGNANTASGFASSVSGGLSNKASGEWSSVSGGTANTASGKQAFVGGGGSNTASGEASSVTGGGNGVASGTRASVSGGGSNVAKGEEASISGGLQNAAEAIRTSVSGGFKNKAVGKFTAVSGGQENEAGSDKTNPFPTETSYDSVSGGFQNIANGGDSSVSGGERNTTLGLDTSVSGGTLNRASGVDAWVRGGGSNKAEGDHSAIFGGEKLTVNGFAEVRPACVKTGEPC